MIASVSVLLFTFINNTNDKKTGETELAVKKQTNKQKQKTTKKSVVQLLVNAAFKSLLLWCFVCLFFLLTPLLSIKIRHPPLLSIKIRRCNTSIRYRSLFKNNFQIGHRLNIGLSFQHSLPVDNGRNGHLCLLCSLEQICRNGSHPSPLCLQF